LTVAVPPFDVVTVPCPVTLLAPIFADPVAVADCPRGPFAVTSPVTVLPRCVTSPETLPPLRPVWLKDLVAAIAGKVVSTLTAKVAARTMFRFVIIKIPSRLR
jgi:hypothetical protein